jgi:GxxExxY protein
MSSDRSNANTQKEFRVLYRDKEVGVYSADMVVDEKVIVEVKAVEPLTDVHRAQLLNYMRLAGLRVGLLFNFAGKRLQYERMVL